MRKECQIQTKGKYSFPMALSCRGRYKLGERNTLCALIVERGLPKGAFV